MYKLEITDETRRRIGDLLTNADGETVSWIAALSRVTGISRVTLARWTKDARRLYWLTRHIPDAVIARPHGRRFYSHDSRHFDHAQELCDRVRHIRADAAAGAYGETWQREERERRRLEE